MSISAERTVVLTCAPHCTDTDGGERSLYRRAGLLT